MIIYNILLYWANLRFLCIPRPLLTKKNIVNGRCVLFATFDLPKIFLLKLQTWLRSFSSDENFCPANWKWMLFSLYYMCYCKASTIIRCMVFNYFAVKSCGIFVIVDQNWCPLSIWTVGQVQPNSSHWRRIGCCSQVCRKELPQPFISAYRFTGQSIIVTNPLLKLGMLSLFYLHNTTWFVYIYIC